MNWLIWSGKKKLYNTCEYIYIHFYVFLVVYIIINIVMEYISMNWQQELWKQVTEVPNNSSAI